MVSSVLWPPGADFQPDLSREYYVIIGMGFSALVNHLTLVAQGEAGRLGGLPVLHIGFTDPWALYDPAGMGQWACLLTLPGFQYRPGNPYPEDFLLSAEFARTSERQWLDLASRRRFWALRALVRSIQRLGTGFEVRCGRESEVVVRAARVDVCGGPGPARRLAPHLVHDPALWTEYEGGPANATAWPRLLTGEMFLRASTALPPPNSLIAVFGGGSTAAWCVERAQKRAGSHVLWVSREPLNEAFLPTRRNDGLAQGPLTRTLRQGLLQVDGLVYPSDPRTRFAEGYEITSVATAGPSVEVNFGATALPRHVESARNPLPQLQLERFEQLVVAIGQVRELREPDSWANILDPTLSPALRAGKHLIRDLEGRAVGLQSDDGALRVLGASALNHPYMDAHWKPKRNQNTQSTLYMGTLPQQARVPIGITLSAITIAQANGYFGPARPMTNLNVASELELQTLFQQPVYQEMSSAWMEMRKARIHPFILDELKAVCGSGRDRY